MRDEVVADMISGRTMAPMQRPEIAEVMVEPGDSVHLGTKHTVRVPVPSDGLRLYCVVACQDFRGKALSVAGAGEL